MVELKEINEDNFEECIALKLNKEQSKFIASNLFSLAEAYAIKNSGMNTPITYGVYNDNIMVGFIMAVYQPIDKNDPEDFENVFYLEDGDVIFKAGSAVRLISPQFMTDLQANRL